MIDPFNIKSSILGIIVFCLIISTEIWADPFKLFDNQQYKEAENEFREELEKDRDRLESIYNLGVTLFQQQKFTEAIDAFSQAARSQDRKMKSQALYNRSVAEIMLNRLENAKKSLQEALSYDLENTKIKENLQWLEKFIEDQEKQKNEKKETEKSQDPQETQSEQDQQNSKQSSEKEQDQKAEENSHEEKQQQSDQNHPSSEQESAENQGQSQQQQNQDESSHSEQRNAAQDQNHRLSDAQSQSENKNSLTEKEGGRNDRSENTEPSSENSDHSSSAANSQNENQRSLSSSDEDSKDKNLSVQEMKKQDAEKLIRSVDDQVGRYYLPIDPEEAKRKNGGKNW